MITVELFGGPHDGRVIHLPELVGFIRVKKQHNGESIYDVYRPAGFIKKGVYVYVVKYGT